MSTGLRKIVVKVSSSSKRDRCPASELLLWYHHRSSIANDRMMLSYPRKVTSVNALKTKAANPMRETLPQEKKNYATLPQFSS